MLVGEVVKELRSGSSSQRIIDAVSSMLLMAECNMWGILSATT